MQLQKKSNEAMAHSYSHIFGLPSTGLRFFIVYGPWGRPDMALYIFTRKILTGEPIDVFGHGRMKRDFTYIDDIIEGIVRLMPKVPQVTKPDTTNADSPFRVYNIGNNNPVDLARFIRAIEVATGIEAKQNNMPMQAGDVPITYADVDDLMFDVDFRPDTSIEEGISKFADWYRAYTNYSNELGPVND